MIKFCEALPSGSAVRQIAEQLVDSAGATDSNYRAACRARSRREFIAKVGVAAEEADESKGWLELLVESNCVTIERAQKLIQEADELVSIFVSSHKTAENRMNERDRLRKRRQRRKRLPPGT